MHIPGKDVGPARQRLAGGLPKFWEGMPSMELAGETDKKRGGVSVSVHNVISGNSPGIITFGARDLGIVGGGVPEARGGACGIPEADNGAEGKEAEGQYL